MTELTGPRSSPDSPSKTFESPLSDLSPAVKGPKVATRCVAGLPHQADDRQDQADGQHGGAGDHEPLGVPHGRGDQPAAARVEICTFVPSCSAMRGAPVRSLTVPITCMVVPGRSTLTSRS